eukprot:scaffold79385_cov27-Tisochrysis_lutea.AAC.5
MGLASISARTSAQERRQAPARGPTMSQESKKRWKREGGGKEGGGGGEEEERRDVRDGSCDADGNRERSILGQGGGVGERGREGERGKGRPSRSRSSPTFPSSGLWSSAVQVDPDTK